MFEEGADPLSGVGFFPSVPGGVIPAKAGSQEISQKEQGRTLDARLRGHDGLEQSNKQKTRKNCGQQEKPTLVSLALSHPGEGISEGMTFTQLVMSLH